MATITESEQNGLPLPEENRGLKTAPTPPKKRLRLKGFSWRRHWPIVALAAVLSILWLLPVFIAHTPIIDNMVRKAAADLKGTVHVQSASLGWFSPLVLRGVEVRGPDDQPLLEIPEARGEISLLGALFGKAPLGHFRLHEPKLNLVLRDGGSNLEDAIAAYLKSTEPSTIDVAVEAMDGTVLVQEARTRRSWQIDKFQLSWIDPLDPGKPVEWKLSGVVADGGRSGKIEAALTIRGQGSEDGGQGSGARGQGARGQGDEAILKTENAPLGLFDSLVGRFVPGVRLDGRISSSLEARWDAQKADGQTVVRGTLSGEGVSVRHRTLGSDQPRLERLRASGQVAWQKGRVQCDKLSVQSDLGNLSFDGNLDLSGSAGGSAATLGQSWDLNGQLDLARLSAILPNTLSIRKGTEISSGQVQLALSSRRAEEGMVWRGRLEASNVAAVRDGRRLLWKEPISITLAARDSRQGPVFDSLKCEASFLSASASGTRDALSGSASFDFSKLASQTADFVDLGGRRLTGDGWANFNWKRLSQGSYEGSVELHVDRFQWGLADRAPWEEKRFHASVSATIGTDFSRKHRIETAVATLETGEDQWSVRLMQPVADLQAGRPWTLEVHSTGELAQWQPRLGTWLAAHQWKLGGKYDLLSEVSWSKGAVGVRQAQFNVDQLVLESPAWKIREPRVEMAATGGWDRRRGGSSCNRPA